MCLKKIITCIVAYGYISCSIFIMAESPDENVISWDEIKSAMNKKSAIGSEIENGDGQFLIYTVQRGDTWESIAEQHGVTTEKLIDANPFITGCHVGMEITVPCMLSPLELAQKEASDADYRYTLANRAYDDGDYKKARKIFSEIIKEGNAPAWAYYHRGLCNRNLNKHDDCAYDMQRVIEADPSGEIYTDASEIQRAAENKAAVRKARRAELWGGILQGIANGVQTYQQAQMYASSHNATRDPFADAPVESTIIGGWNPNLTAAGINPPAFMSKEYWIPILEESNQRIYDRMMTEKADFIQSYKHFNPYASEQDAENAYTNYLIQNNQIMMEANASSTDNYSVSELQPSTTAQTSTRYESRYGDKDCYSCRGSGRCTTCGGKGYVENYGKTSECPNCLLVNMKRTGLCSTCGGKGTVYGIK